MGLARLLLLLAAGGCVSWAATLGTVVSLIGGASDLVLDEARGRLYLVNPNQTRIEIYSIAQRRFLAPVRTDALPLAAAMSRNGKFLYVTSHEGASLNVIDLDTATLVNRVSLPAKPEGIAVGNDGRVLLTTIGTGPGNLQDTLLIWNPDASAAASITNVVITPPAAMPPQLPPLQGRISFSSRSQMIATPSGDLIIGMNAVNNNTRVLFVYEVASGTVLRSRIVNEPSNVLSVSPDGSRFMAGLRLFDTATLSVLAQQNAANAPYAFPPNTNFNLQQSQGGSVFSPDGGTLYSAFNIAPVQNPPARANASQLMLNDPDNLLINLGLQLPENLVANMVISSDGSNIYALSESGFLILPVGQIRQSPIAVPASPVVLLRNDQCGVSAADRRFMVEVRNEGRGRLTASATLSQTANTGAGGLGGAAGPGGGAPGGGVIIVIPPAPGPAQPGQNQQQAGIAQTAPQVRTIQTAAGPSFEFTYNAVNSRSPGTNVPHEFLVQSAEAINIPPSVRVFQNHRDSESRGEVIPVAVAPSANEGLTDMVLDSARQRIYISNSGLNRVEVFDTRRREFMTPIKVGQLPRALALTPDGGTLYVANTGGESISIIDAEKLEVIGRVKFPPIPFNGNTAVVTPSVIAASQRGLQIVMANGTLWKVVGDEAIPRNVSPVIGANTVQAPRTMVATPGGEYVLLLGGNGSAYLYDALADEYVQARQVATAPIQGYFGPVGAGLRGQFFLANENVLNQALTITASATLPGGNARRPVSAVAATGATTYARFVQPVRANANTVVTENPVIEMVDANTGQTMRSFPVLEGPISTQTGNTRVNVNGRTMAIDAAGTTAYVLTTSGLSIVPLDPVSAANRPILNANGTLSAASYLPNTAPGGLVALFGRNLGSSAAASETPLPTVMAGTCVTLNNVALPLLMTSEGQINAQVPPELAPGRYPLVVRSIDRRIASVAQQVTVSRYAPAVFVNPSNGEALVYHTDGRPVTKDRPAKRDQRLVIYATGLGATSGGRVTAGMPAPSSPLAVTEELKVFFGDPRWSQAEVIVEWSGLAPGFVGLYQINVYVPGDHIRGEKVPITLRIGNIDSQITGPAAPVLAVD